MQRILRITQRREYIMVIRMPPTTTFPTAASRENLNAKDPLQQHKRLLNPRIKLIKIKLKIPLRHSGIEPVRSSLLGARPLPAALQVERLPSQPKTRLLEAVKRLDGG